MKTPPPLTWGSLDHKNYTAISDVVPIARITWSDTPAGPSHTVQSLLPTQTDPTWQREFSSLEAAKARAALLWHLWCYHAGLCILPPWQALTPRDRQLAATRLERADQLDAMRAAGWIECTRGRWRDPQSGTTYHAQAVAVIRWIDTLGSGGGMPTTNPTA